ncbi:DUF2946 family protein [Halomonas sp.]|uniref:DUF2946 family protein n=1 Tax=Halomonas sp. TaxID=1486246 RepID=UPI0025C1964A|nr:DUF2946 family protein [Halomonas sp.]
MDRLIRTSSTQRTGGRLLALLLALLLAMVTLSSHGAMKNHQVSCGIAAEWMSDDGHSGEGHSGHGHSADHEASSCVTCTNATGQARLSVAGPQRQASSPATAMPTQIPLTPRRPPKA